MGYLLGGLPSKSLHILSEHSLKNQFLSQTFPATGRTNADGGLTSRVFSFFGQDGTGRTGQAEQDRQNRQAEDGSQGRTARAGCQERNADTGLPGQDSHDRRGRQNRIGKAGPAERDMQNGTCRTRHAEQNRIL
jgi:hypothetical protein